MRSIGFSLCALTLALGCSSSDEGSPKGSTPYQLGQALVIGNEKGGEPTVVDASCETAACEAARERCGEEAFADVILAEDGEVLDVICYKREVAIVELGGDPVASATAGNNTVLVLDGEDDGVDVEGDVTLEGNNAVVFGEGADVSVIGGTLRLEKNNAVVRGVTIKGDVTIDKNNAKLIFTTIEGDLTISGNNTTVAESRVLGEIRVLGVNTVLVQNELATDSVTGKNLSCNDNVRIEPQEPADAGAPPAEEADAGAPAAAEPSPVVCTNSKTPLGKGPNGNDD